MYDRILKRLQQKVRVGEFVITLHADEEMDADELSIVDVEHCILNGRILERQKDPGTGESKYRIRGQTRAGQEMDTIAKFGPTGKLMIITVYLM